MYIDGHIVRPPRKWYQFMLDIAWPELIVIGIVAVVAIGPKDLPRVMNNLGRMAGKARMMAQDFQRSMDQLNFEAEAADRVKNTPVMTASSHTHAKHGAAHHAAPADTQQEPPHEHLGST